MMYKRAEFTLFEQFIGIALPGSVESKHVFSKIFSWRNPISSEEYFVSWGALDLLLCSRLALAD